MTKRKRNLTTLGALTIVAAALFFWGLFWLLGNPLFKGGFDVAVVLDNGGGLKRSDRVGGVIVDLRLDDKFALAQDTRAVVRGDVFGAHVVELTPGQSLLKLSSGDTIRGGSTPQLAEMASGISERVESVLSRADDLLSPDAVRDVHATASVLPAGAEELRAAFAELRLASAALRRTAENIETADAGPALRGAIGEVENSARALTSAAGRMEASINSMGSVFEKINAGGGTLGRLVNDSTMYIEMNSTLREVRALATDIRERPGRYINVRLFGGSN
jgi:phospholipid/cholesterol/gamma-HCH transport system substrate-binding protein